MNKDLHFETFREAGFQLNLKAFKFTFKFLLYYEAPSRHVGNIAYGHKLRIRPLVLLKHGHVVLKRGNE